MSVFFFHILRKISHQHKLPPTSVIKIVAANTDLFHLHAVNVKMTKSRKSYLLLFSISFSVALYIPIFTIFQFLKWFSIIKPDRLVIMKLWLALVYSPYSGSKVQPSYYRILFSLRRLILNLCLVFGYFDKWTRNELKLSLGSFYSTIVSKYYWISSRTFIDTFNNSLAYSFI